MSDTTIEENINRMLEKYVPVTKEITGKDLSVGRIKQLLDHVGNPHERLKIIHIAGTSGKTSTAYYCAELLRLAGRKVGMTVSPHIDSITERVQINGVPLAPSVFNETLKSFLVLVEDFEPLPSYFELLIAFAFWVFDREGVDYAVVETGLGGLHDGTNAARKPDKICVITDIGLDHTHILGDTLQEIAAQKAGIIHRGNTVIMYQQAPEIMEVVRRRADEQSADLHLIEPGDTSRLELPPFQARNWQLACEVYTIVGQRDGLRTLSDDELAMSRHIKIPGRMEIWHWGDKLLVMDGAHNAQKMAAFIASFQRQFPDIKPAVLLSVRTKKDFGEVIGQLAEIASTIILTTFKVIQDITHESEKLEIIVDYCKARGFTKVVMEPDKYKALALLKSQPEEVCVITGSFYLLHYLRPILFEEEGIKP